jgi:capsular polysaccharide biosynthesis protein
MMARPDQDERPTFFQRSVRRFQLHPALVSICVAVGLVAGLGFALAQPTTYEADCRMLVGSFEAPSDQIPGYVLASQQVASDYARVAMSPAVLNPVAESLALPVGELRGRATVTAIPESTVIRITGTGDGPDGARTVAEGMCTGLQQEIDRLNSDEGRAAQLAALHTQAAEVLAAAQVAVADAQRALAVATAGGNATAIQQAQAALGDARLREGDAQLRVDGYREQYLADQERVSTSSRIRQLGPASVRETSTLYTRTLFAVIGIVVGLVVGLGLAAARERRAVEGRHAAPTDERTARPSNTASANGRRTATEPAAEPSARPAGARTRSASGGGS